MVPEWELPLAMTRLSLAKRIASIVVYGHIALFGFGLMVMLASPYSKSDTAQMMLMGSPLLAMVGLSAYRFMANLPSQDETARADEAWVNMSTIASSAFIIALFVAYGVAALNTSISITILKFIVGAIETVLGGYLGVSRDVLFPENEVRK
jgi:hypothetical protein